MSQAPTLLLIDDSRFIHNVVRARLAFFGVHVLSAFSGEEGLLLARSFEPNLILLDVEMPSLDGFEVCRRLKADATLADIPVIFLVGASPEKQTIRGLELGAVECLAKPIDPAELQATVVARLEMNEMVGAGDGHGLLPARMQSA
jgi:DNA-binding response OmpR family regulator